jgi:hypothetical protein
MPGTSIHMLTDPRRAVGRIAFLVARDQQRERAAGIAEPRKRRDIGRDRALHVVRPAPDEQAILDLASERASAPPVAGGHDVEMPGKAEMRRAFAAHRNHILGWAVGRLAHDPAIHPESERCQRGFEQVEHLALRRSHARAANQLGGKLDGIDRHGPAAVATLPWQASRAGS